MSQFIKAVSGSVKNHIINANFDIWQRGTSFSSMADGAYGPDRWVYKKTNSANVTLSRESTILPAVTQGVPLSKYSLKVSVTVSDTSIAAGDYAYIAQQIEGCNFKNLAQRAMVLSFWVRSSDPGTYCVALMNSGSNRSYIAEYTISSVDTWEKKVILVPASPSAGTWDYVTGIGISVRFILACGSTFQGTAGQWNSSNVFGTSNQYNFLNSSANIMYFSQVQLELGTSASKFESVLFQDDLLNCQRYYQKSFQWDITPVQNSANFTNLLTYVCKRAGVAQDGLFLPYKCLMRGSPTMTYFNPSAANANWRNVTAGADSGAVSSYAQGENGILVLNAQAAGDNLGEIIGVHYTADAEL